MTINDVDLRIALFRAMNPKAEPTACRPCAGSGIGATEADNCGICHGVGSRWPVERMPAYSHDLNAIADVEREIERRGLWLAYVRLLPALIDEAGFRYDSGEKRDWLLITTASEVRAIAAHRVLVDGGGE